MNKVDYLANVINEYQLQEIEYKDKEMEVTLKKGYLNDNFIKNDPIRGNAPIQARSKAAEDKGDITDDHADHDVEERISEKDKGQKKNTEFIRAPLAGIFYSRPAPDAKPFVRSGEKVSDKSILCIIKECESIDCL